MLRPFVLTGVYYIHYSFLQEDMTEVTNGDKTQDPQVGFGGDSPRVHPNSHLGRAIVEDAQRRITEIQNLRRGGGISGSEQARIAGLEKTINDTREGK